MQDELHALRSGLPRPSGPFRVVDGDAARQVFEEARAVDRGLLCRHDELVGFEIVEVKPVLLGGDASAIDNKRAIDRETHRDLVRFWATTPDHVERFPLARCQPAPDYDVLSSEDEFVIFIAGDVRLALWPRAIARRHEDFGEGAPFIFGSDGSGTAYAWGRNERCAGVFELPFIPLAMLPARFVGPTISDLLDQMEVSG